MWKDLKKKIHSMGLNGLFHFRVFSPLETKAPRCQCCFAPSLCCASPWTWETIELVADQRASLAGHKHFRHIKCAAALLAWPHLHTLSLCCGGSKLDLIERGATEEGRDDAKNMSPSTIFFKGLTSNTQAWSTSQPACYFSDFVLLLCTMAE